MKIGAIIQARMTSSRMPGKILTPIHGRPLLQYVCERVQNCNSRIPFVVATSTDATDDPVVNFCEKQGIRYYRGSLLDVSSRFKGASEENHFEAFVRICADSPLLDQNIIDHCVKEFVNGEWDLVTNLHPRTFPKGQSVEVIRSSAFDEILKRMLTEDEREHVTRHFYKNSSQFRIKNVQFKKNLSEIQLSVDSSEDLKQASQIIQKMKSSHWSYNLDAILSLIEKKKLTRVAA